MGKCKFRSDWLEKTDSSNVKVSLWGKKCSETELICTICTSTINIESKGFQAILHHSESFKHKKNFNCSFGPNQLHLEVRPPLCASSDLSTSKPCTSTSMSMVPTVALYNVKDSSTIAELIWTMKSICGNYSTDSCQDIIHIFSAMFPKAVPDHFSLSPKKMRYLITDALAPYFHENMLQEAQSAYYTLSYDETTNVKDRKELQTTIRYWSESRNKVTSHHLRTFFLGKADADTLHKKISEAVSGADLSLHKCLMLGSDGPNVNKKVFRLFNNDVKEIRNKGLVDIGTCNIHIMHNAYVKALKSLGLEASELLVSIHNYFDGWPARYEEYEEIQSKLNLPHNKFLKHATTRWLTLGPAATRLLEQWDGVSNYFFKYIPMKKKSDVLQSSSYKKIVSILKLPSIKAELYFIVSSADLCTKFTKPFQGKEPMIHKLNSEIVSIVKAFLGRVLKSSVLREITNFSKVNQGEIFSADKLLPLHEVVISWEVQEEISKLTEKEKLSFLTLAQKHYVTACQYILEKSCLSSGSVKAFRFLDPNERQTMRSCHEIVKVTRMMPFDIPQDILLDEWKVLQMEKDAPGLDYQNMKIDAYWHWHISKKDSSGDLKFPNVAKVIKAALTLTHGNADIERQFSISKWVLTDNKSAMTERFLNAVLTVKDALKEYNNFPHLVPVTKSLITFGQQAHKKYLNYMEECKRQKMMEDEKRKEEENKKKDFEEEMKRLEKVKNSIEVVTVELNEKKRDHQKTKELTEELFSEATGRLKKALETNDLKGAKLAHGMLEGVRIMQADECAKAKEVESIQKSLEKRKSTLITSFFSKKFKSNEAL